MKYHVTVNNETFDVEVERAPGSVRTVARYASDASSYVPTKSSAKPVQNTVPTAVAQTKAPAQISVPVVAQTSVSTSSVNDETGSEVLSPMPGSVWKVLVNVGDNVKNGQPVVILEAMKMEIEVAATANGVIDKICVTQGQTVNTSDLIAIIK